MSEMSELNSSATGLSAQVGRLRTAVTNLDSTIRRRTVVIGAFLAGIILVLLATVPAMIVVSFDNRDAIAENNRRWCPIVVPLAPRPGDPPPQGTPEQQARSNRIRAAFADLVHDFNCPVEKAK